MYTHVQPHVRYLDQFYIPNTSILYSCHWISGSVSVTSRVGRLCSARENRMEEMEAQPEALPLDDGTSPIPQANGLDQREKEITPVISSESCLKSVEPPDSAATLSLNGRSKEDHHFDGGGSSQEMPTDSPTVEEREPSYPGHSAELGDKTASDFSASDTNRDRGGDSEGPSDVVPSVEGRTVGHARLFEDSSGEKGEEGLNSPAECTEGGREEDLRFDVSDSQPEGPPPQELYPDAEVNGGRETLEPTEGDHGDKQEYKGMGDVYSTVISPQRVQRQPSPMNTCSLEDEMEQVEQKEEAKRKKQERRSQLLMSAGVMLQGTAPPSANSTLEDSSPIEPAPVSPPEGITPSPETASAKIQDGGDISSNGEGERDAPSQESGVTSGQGRTTEDRNLEELSEILLDSDSDSNGNSSRLRAARETNSSRTAGKRVSFADEVREIRSGAVEKKLSEDGRGDLRAIGELNTSCGCTQTNYTYLCIPWGGGRGRKCRLAVVSWFEM